MYDNINTCAFALGGHVSNVLFFIYPITLIDIYLKQTKFALDNGI